MREWRNLENRVLNLSKKVKIALVGKYVSLQDAYLSVAESLRHAGYAHDAEVNIDWIDSETITAENVQEILGDADGILVPGGLVTVVLKVKFQAIKYARENNVPFQGICLGYRVASIEFARNVLG